MRTLEESQVSCDIKCTLWHTACIYRVSRDRKHLKYPCGKGILCNFLCQMGTRFPDSVYRNNLCNFVPFLLPFFGRKEVISAITLGIDYFLICLKRVTNSWFICFSAFLVMEDCEEEYFGKKPWKSSFIPEKKTLPLFICYLKMKQHGGKLNCCGIYYDSLRNANGKGEHVQNVCSFFLFHYIWTKLESSQILCRRENASKLILKYTHT